MLLWMWISAQVLLLGAEINAIVEHKSPDGKGAGARTGAEPAPKGTKTEVEDAGGALPASPPGAALDERLALKRRREGAPPPPVNFWARTRDIALGAAFVGVLFKLRDRKG